MRLAAILFLLATFSLGGCASNTHTGDWKADLEVKRNFETGYVLSNHTYYYCGPYNNPDAVIAIDDHYTLREGPVWAKIEGEPDKILKKWLKMFQMEGVRTSFYCGGVILTPDGQRAGIWYSQGTNNYVEMPTPGTLVISEPSDM